MASKLNVDGGDDGVGWSDNTPSDPPGRGVKTHFM